MIIKFTGVWYNKMNTKEPALIFEVLFFLNETVCIFKIKNGFILKYAVLLLC